VLRILFEHSNTPLAIISWKFGATLSHEMLVTRSLNLWKMWKTLQSVKHKALTHQ
jgi:hypothetical protein